MVSGSSRKRAASAGLLLALQAHAFVPRVPGTGALTSARLYGTPDSVARTYARTSGRTSGRRPATTMLLDPQSSFDATDFVIGRVFPVAGLLLSAAFSLSPLPKLKDAKDKGDLGKFDPMPQAINMASGASWMLYASLAENYFPMISGAGAYASSYLSVLMARDAADAETRKSLDDVTQKMAYGLAAAAFAAVLLTATGHHTLAMNAAGLLANALILCVYVSPLKNMQSVMATKDASSIFLPWSALQLINNLLWVVYGSYVRDKYVFTSSLVGVVSAVAAVMLKAIYPSQPEHYHPRYAIVKWMPDPDVLLK